MVSMLHTHVCCTRTGSLPHPIFSWTGPLLTGASLQGAWQKQGVPPGCSQATAAAMGEGGPVSPGPRAELASGPLQLCTAPLLAGRSFGTAVLGSQAQGRRSEGGPLQVWLAASYVAA